ncbi:MAG TPA: hypothetical protein VMA95_19005 [Streptosporangiaceae bacterium]|nr:hypothetical protein [Streptosporangiaceae bacterium]
MRKLHKNRRRLVRATSAITAAGAMIAGSLALAGAASGTALAARTTLTTTSRTSPETHVPTCRLKNGIKHIVQIGFDNVHYYRDNPNVPSDLEMLPNLLNFIEDNGTLLTNNHTPLIAHTADDLLTTATGLYGDRQGNGIANSYQTYNPDGTTDPATSFTYWNDPIYDTASTPATGHDTNPNLVYSPVPPATANPPVTPDKVAPAPWVPFTRAGCDVGEIATVDQELENPSPDLADVFGPNSPEVAQLNADTDPYKDPETADYLGLAIHCAKKSPVCGNAEAVKYGQTTPSHTAVPDLLPDEPGGYNGYQALFGNKYIAPVIGGGDNVVRNGYQVTDAAGNLVDLNGNQINGAYLTNYPGFPGYDNINASQALAYAADMLESGVQVANIYMADLHGNEFIPSLDGKGGPCYHAPDALGSGSACYVAQAQYYNQAFGTFFQRLAAEGITPANTLFIVSSDEGDHEAGANVGRAISPTPANCDGATVSGDTVTSDVPCTYPAGSFGELDANVTGLLATEEGNTTPFSLEDDTAPEFYVTGNPGPDTTEVRSLEHDVAGITFSNPYSGVANEKIDNYLADPTEEAILHMADADPARTPTFAMFAKPDYYLYSGSSTCSGPCVQIDTGYAWDHGDYAAEINTNYVGFAGPGVKNLGLDGNQPDQGPSSAGANSGNIEVDQTNLAGPWTDETDIRPTIMYLTGLRDDYTEDGRVISQILANPNRALSAWGVTDLGECYKQLNSSVGEFGGATLAADTAAIDSTSAGDATYLSVDNQLRALEVARDALASTIKNDLWKAEFKKRDIRHVSELTSDCESLISQAQHLAG